MLGFVLFFFSFQMVFPPCAGLALSHPSNPTLNAIVSRRSTPAILFEVGSPSLAQSASSQLSSPFVMACIYSRTWFMSASYSS